MMRLCYLSWAQEANPPAQEFVAAPALEPPEVQVDQAVLEQYQKEMADAAQMPLPDEDDADL